MGIVLQTVNDLPAYSSYLHFWVMILERYSIHDCFYISSINRQ